MKIILLSFLVGLGFLSSTAMAKELSDLNFSLKEGLLTSILAKELCSCHFVEGFPLKTCTSRTGLPDAALSMVVIRVNEKYKSVDVKASLLSNVVRIGEAPRARALFNSHRPEFGCRIQFAGRGISNTP